MQKRDERGHVIAEGEERNARRARSNESKEGFGVVNGGGIE